MTSETTDTSEQPATNATLFSPRYRLTTVGLVIVVTLIAFEGMSVNTALPTAARQLHGLGSYGWAFTGFIVAMLVGLVASGLMCDWRGPRPSLTAGLSMFFAGLVLSGTAGAMGQLIAGRFVQGFGAGLLLTALYVMIGECYPGAVRPKVMATISSAWVIPSLVGPPVSGLLTQHLTWRLVFLGLAPLVIVGGLLMVPALRAQPMTIRSAETGGSIRLLAAVLIAGGVAALVQAGQHPRLGWLIAAPFAVVAVGWGLSRLLPRGTWTARPGVPAAVALRGLFAGAMFGVDALVPLMLTVQHGFGATAAGLPLLAAAVTWAAGSWWQGRDAMSAHRPALVQLGFCFLAVACAVAAWAALPSGPALLIYPAWALAGCGAGLVMSSVGVLLLQWTNDADRGRDSAALQLADGVVSAFTTGIGGVLVAAAAHAYIGYTTAFVSIDLAMVGVAALGILAAARLRQSVPG